MIATAGVDIGSTTSKAVVLVDGQPAAHVISASSTNPARSAEQVYDEALAKAGLERGQVAYVVGTGYGRTRVAFANRDVSEITCHGRGAHFLLPSARTVIDIGGQDTKVICLDEGGNLLDFAMNDKCAAGTGRFLEAMARSLEIEVHEMGAYALSEGAPCRITSMCSVFAESEVINLIHDGIPLPRIVKGLLLSLASRVSSQARRVGLVDDVVMTGGVAKNDGVRRALEERLGTPLHGFGAADPQVIGALGAALIAHAFALGAPPPHGVNAP